MTAKVVQFKQIGAISFHRNRRSKSIKISVKPDKSVRVSFPHFVQIKEVAEFVRKNTEWIRAQQEKMDLRKNKIDHQTTLQTKLHKVFFLEGEKQETKINGNVVQIFATHLNSDLSRDYIESVMVEIYRFEAKKLLPPRLLELARAHGFAVNKITIRNNKRNWGSCSSQNNISLNLQMMKLPNELIDYILLHELAHTEIKNHGPQFWAKLDSITNFRARELANAVKKYSTYTL